MRQTFLTIEKVRFLEGIAVSALVLLGAGMAGAVTLDWVVVGRAGNAADDTGHGSVARVYRIGEYEVTNAQYADFLNAVAALDDNGLFDSRMEITRSGSSGSYTYAVNPGMGDQPVNWVSFYDSLRFVNWMENGQPAGTQDIGTTEDGSYTFSGPTSVGPRNGGARFVLPNEDEWYKAAYFGATSETYYDYPCGTDTQTTCEAPEGGTNSANCSNAHLVLTDVGAYVGSPSPSGTFDQGGNVREWNESIIGSERGLRGGGWDSLPSDLAASTRESGDPTTGSNSTGFRVAMISGPLPVLTPPLLSILGLTLAMTGAFAMARTRWTIRRRSIEPGASSRSSGSGH